MKTSHTAVLDVRSVLDSSCAFSIEPVDELKLTANGLKLTFPYLRRNSPLRTLPKMQSYISAVTFRVFVFCRDG